MKVTYKIRTGMGTLLNPTFRCVEHIVTEFCDNLVEMGNSSLIYMMRGGYVHHTIDRDMIVKIENNHVMEYTIGFYEDFNKSWQMSDEDYNTLDDALAYVYGLGKDDWACHKKFKIYRGSSSENRWSTFMELSYKYGQLCITKIIA